MLHRASRLLILLVAGAAACSSGDNLNGPATGGTLKITTATSGTDMDPDGYTVQVDAQEAGPIGSAATIERRDIPAGTHSVQLSGVAPNCAVEGSNPRSVTVAAGATAEVSFAISCSSAAGSLEIRTATTGANPDPDGYAISVDDGTAQPIGINATLTVPGIPAGPHRVSLTGLASNCSVQGDNPQPVTVTGGASVSVGFTVSCPPPAGSSWKPMASGTTKFLENISGSSANNIFVAGSNEDCNTCTAESTILHYDGTSWSTQLTHAGVLGVWGLWAAPTGQAFALAEGPFPGPIMYYDGQQWSSMAEQPPAPAQPEEAILRTIWGASATNVFAGGWRDISIGHFSAHIVHYDGTHWSVMNLAGGEDLYVVDLWGSSATDVYAVASYEPYDYPQGNRAVILHYDGQTWSEELRQPNLAFGHIWGTSASDVYATGSSGSAGAVWHYDGHGWSAMAIPTAPPLTSIWGSSSRDIYVLANFRAPGRMWHFDGATWTEVKTNASVLMDIWGSSASDIFVVGQNGTILHGP